MSFESALFANHARAKAVEFTCAPEICMVGAYCLRQGDAMRAVSDGTGLFWLYVDWAEVSLGRVPAAAVNKLAGKEIISAHYLGSV